MKKTGWMLKGELDKCESKSLQIDSLCKFLLLLFACFCAIQWIAMWFT